MNYLRCVDGCADSPEIERLVLSYADEIVVDLWQKPAECESQDERQGYGRQYA